MTIDWTHFTPLTSLVGGVMIGLAAAVLVLWCGRIAGISGIVGKILEFKRGDTLWRITFIVGLILSPLVYQLFAPLPALQVDSSLLTLSIAGLLVGFGTSLGSGCTSGHGICGLSRFSVRSLAATISFMACGLIVVFIARHVLAW